MTAMVDTRQATSVVVQPHDEGTFVLITGPIDRHNAADLRARLHAIIEKAPGPLLLDLAEVEVDTTGLGLLLECHRRGQRLGHEMRLVAVSPNLQRLLRRFGMARRFGAGAGRLPLSA